MAGQLQGGIKGEISTETVPCMHVEWEVPENILMSPWNTDRGINSPSFHFKDATWHLSLIVRAQKRKAFYSICHDFIDLYLVKKYPVSSEFRVTYHMGIKSADGYKYQNLCGHFAKKLESDLHCWGNSVTLSRFHIIRKKTELTENGVVSFFCYFWVETAMSSQKGLFEFPVTKIAGEISENIGEVSLEILPSTYAEWNVPGFPLLFEDTKHSIRSFSFQFNDEIWYFHATIHDTEFIRDEICGPIDLHLVRKQCAAPIVNIHCMNGIKLVDGSICKYEHDEYVFDGNVDSHVLSNTTSRLDGNIIEAPNGVVKFFCYFRLESPRNSPEDSNLSEEESWETEEEYSEFEGEVKESEEEDTDWEEEISESQEECSESKAYSQGKQLKDIDLTQELKKREGLEKLGTDFRNLFLSCEDSDVTIRVNSKEFKAHKNILRARSSIFHSMFTHDMAEKNSGTVDVTDCSPDAFEIFLIYLYSGSVENLSTNTVFDLFRVADKYDTQVLKHNCKEFIVTSLSVDTVCDIIEHALQYNDAQLLKTGTDFFAKNLKDIIVTVKWQSFLKTNTIEANELFIKASNYYILKE